MDRGTSTGLKASLILINAGATINQHIYINILRDEVFFFSEKKVTRNKGITLQQNGTTSHTAKLI